MSNYMKALVKRDPASARRRDAVYTAYAGLPPIAPRLRTRLTYCDVFTVTTSVGPGLGNAIFNLNGLFDPDSTGVGHQPLGYDQLSALYGKYRVINTGWEISVLPTGVTPSSSLHLVVVPTNTATAFTVFTTAAEQTYSQVKIFNTYNPCVIRGGIDLAQLNGKTHQSYMADDTTAANTTANPAEVLALHCMVLEPAGTGITIRYQVKLNFDCEFSDPVQLAQS